MAEFLRRQSALGWCAGLVGGVTLEVYTVHRFVIDDTPIAGWKFPLNVIVFFFVTLLLSVLVNRAADWLRKELEPRVAKLTKAGKV